ncbi:MAG: ester cyclase [Chloroflexi bacterium]|nr:ester cyclase [Chloroflexota bacterium]
MLRFALFIVGACFLSMAIAAPSLAGAQEATPAIDSSAGPALIEDYLAALNAHEPERVAALYAEDAVVEQAIERGNTFVGRDEIRGWVAANVQGIPDLDVTTESIISEGQRIAWAWVYRGAYTGQFPGLPAGQGQPVELRGVSLLELQDNMIVRETVYFDNSAFLTQIGGSATPTAQPAAATGSVTAHVFVCPDDLHRSIRWDAVESEFAAYEADLLAGCRSFDDPAVAPLLVTLPDQEPTLPGTEVAPGVYGWSDVPFGDYALGSANTGLPPGLGSVLLTRVGTGPVQNPGLRLDTTTPHAEYRYFYFLMTGTPENDSAP